MARLSPLTDRNINFLGRYQFNITAGGPGRGQCPGLEDFTSIESPSPHAPALSAVPATSPLILTGGSGDWTVEDNGRPVPTLTRRLPARREQAGEHGATAPGSVLGGVWR